MVRTQYPTSAPLSVRWSVLPRSSAGQEPSAQSGRCVTPIDGQSRIAPRCTARPARRGWSRPVPLTISTSYGSPSPRTADSRRAPSRIKSSPGWYAAPAAPVTTKESMSLPDRTTTAAAVAESPSLPGPGRPRGKAAKQPAIDRWPSGGLHCAGVRRLRSCCSRMRSSAEPGRRSSLARGGFSAQFEARKIR